MAGREGAAPDAGHDFEKPLAAQLAKEFRKLLPHNAIGYFVSYKDQREAYVPQAGASTSQMQS